MALAAFRSKAGGSVVDTLLIVTPIVGLCNYSVLLCVALCPFWFCGRLGWEGRVGCIVWFVFMVSRDCCVALPHGDTGLSAVCDCRIF